MSILQCVRRIFSWRESFAEQEQKEQENITCMTCMEAGSNTCISIREWDRVDFRISTRLCWVAAKAVVHSHEAADDNKDVVVALAERPVRGE